MNLVTKEEIAASVIEPHFKAVQDVFSSFEPEPGMRLSKLERVKFIIEPKVHDKPRHFAATRDDALLMMFAPQIIELDIDTLVAILAHEFGHAADFAYPARWFTHDRGPCRAEWIDSNRVEEKVGPRRDTKSFRAWSKLWRDRGKDQVEWAADGIAEAVLDKHITYCKPLLLQSFVCGIDRPKGLR